MRMTARGWSPWVLLLLLSACGGGDDAADAAQAENVESLAEKAVSGVGMAEAGPAVEDTEAQSADDLSGSADEAVQEAE